jgi:hypothetical protein
VYLWEPRFSCVRSARAYRLIRFYAAYAPRTRHGSSYCRTGLATHWQLAIQEEFREARMNRDHPGIHFVFHLHKQS